MAKQLFWLGALVLGFAVLIGDPGSAVAQAQAAVLEFDGRGGSTARRAVVRVVLLGACPSSSMGEPGAPEGVRQFLYYVREAIFLSFIIR